MTAHWRKQVYATLNNLPQLLSTKGRDAPHATYITNTTRGGSKQINNQGLSTNGLTQKQEF